MAVVVPWLDLMLLMMCLNFGFTLTHNAIDVWVIFALA